MAMKAIGRFSAPKILLSHKITQSMVVRIVAIIFQSVIVELL